MGTISDNPNQERYFVKDSQQIYEIEQIIKTNQSRKVFQVVVKNAPEIKRFIWFLLNYDINFERKAAGAGIAIFFVDMTVPFFMKKK